MVLGEVRQCLIFDLLSELTCLRSMKWHIACRVIFIKHVLDGDTGTETEVTSVCIFHGRCETSLTDDNSGELLDDTFKKISESLPKYAHGGNGWTGCCTLLSTGDVHLHPYSVGISHNQSSSKCQKYR